MSIFEDVKVLRKQIEDEKAEVKQDLADQEQEIEETEEVEETVETETETQEQETEKEEAPDNTSLNQLAAKLRIAQREKEALERQLEEVKNKPEKQEQKEPAKTDEDPEPDAEDIEAHLKWELRQLQKEQAAIKSEVEARKKKEESAEIYTRAISNFQRLENKFSKTVEDYDDVSGFVLNKIKDGLKALHPFADEAAVGQAAYTQILQMAENFASRGLNPVEELYALGEIYGYQKQEKEPEKKKASVDTIATNRSKSVNSLAGGTAKKVVANYNPAKMTLKEVKALSPEERKMILKR
jgi:DNA repair exonuclease SbcCD ATPase subunit